MLRIIILGSAAGGGVPQWNCNAEGSRLARSGAIPSRTQSSVAVSADGEHWFLLNASPDLRQQILATPALHPRRGLRDSPIAGVVLTNGDVDHLAGLLTLRESTPLTVYATDRVLGILRENSIFNVLRPEYVQRRPLPLDRALELCLPDGTGSGLEVEAFAVPGKIALYLENPDAGADFGTEPGDTVGLRVRPTGADPAFYYVPGCAALSADLRARLRNAPLVLFDGTLWFDDDMIRAGVGGKTGRRMGHLSMSSADGTITGFDGLGVARKVFVHINNTNPVLLEGSPERRAAEVAGWEIGYDGMEFEL